MPGGTSWLGKPRLISDLEDPNYCLIIPRYATYLNIQHCLHHRLTYLQKNVIISTDWSGVNVRTKSPEPNNNKIKE